MNALSSNGSMQTKVSVDRLIELVRYATLAPSSHNTQCWKFCVDEPTSTITLLPDMDRACPVVDPDHHHVYASLGCALENLLIAAAAQGLSTTIDASHPEHGIPVTVQPVEHPNVSSWSSSTDLFQALPKRQVSRCQYNGQPVDEHELEMLQKAGTGDGVRVILVTDHARMNEIRDHILRSNTAQLSNPAFMREITKWIRFNQGEATKSGDGLSSACTGHPSIPPFLGKMILPWVTNPATENEKITQQIESSAGMAVFVSKHDTPAHWVEAGRCYERFALQGTVLGISNALLNQPLESRDARRQFANMMELCPNERPDLIVRFGKGTSMPKSVRRPLEDVLEVHASSA